MGEEEYVTTILIMVLVCIVSVFSIDVCSEFKTASYSCSSLTMTSYRPLQIASNLAYVLAALKHCAQTNSIPVALKTSGKRFKH